MSWKLNRKLNDMKYRLLFMVLSLLLWVGCYEEEPLTPTEGLEFKYTVPQGNHDYDVKIVDWYEKNGFYILYKFDPKDIYFNVSYWTGPMYDSLYDSWRGNIAAAVAEEDYVGKQLKFVEDIFLNFYSDTILNTWMPMKLLLCSQLKKPNGTKSIEMVGGLDFIAIDYGSPEIEDLLADETRIITFKNDLHYLFFSRLNEQKKLVAPEEFKTISESEYGKRVEQKNMFSLGFLETSTGMKVDADLLSYIRTITSFSYDELIAETEDGDYTMIGILNPKKDVNGLIRKKYDALVHYFQHTLHMDLQAIGNYMKQQPAE